jgi:hypothetical protein
MAHLKAYYQKELEDIKNNMVQMASLLEQLLWAQFRKGTSSEQPTMLPQPTTSVILNSQKVVENPATRP